MSEKTLPIDVLGDWYEVPIQVQLHIIALRERLAELERAAAQPVAWMWNDELGIPHASAGSKKPVWLESSASAEYIKQANLRPLYAVPPAPVAEIREPTPEECERIGLLAGRVSNRMTTCAEEDGRELFDAVRDVMCPKEGL